MYQQPPGNEPDNQNQQQNPLRRSRIIWIILLILLVSWGWSIFRNTANAGTTADINYSRFRQELESGNVASVTLSGEEIQGELQQPITVSTPSGGGEAETEEYTRFITYVPSVGDDELLPLLQEQEVTIVTEPSQGTPLWTILINVLPIFFVLALFYFIYRQMRAQSSGSGIFSINRSQAKRYDKEKEDRTTFSDVAGLDSVKTELREIVAYLKDPSSLIELGGTPPKGVLLVGPPGTGKTLLARAVAGEANVPFFNLTGSDFMEMFVGVGASRVRDLFKQARTEAPCIIFIDELDSIGRRRGAGLGGGHDEREQTLNQLLSELDGFEPTENVIVMAATNRPDILDPALLRPGRFDRRVTVSLPTLETRKKILAIHARDKPLSDNVDLEAIARNTPGFSGADLENILNEAALLAARKKKAAIGWEDLEEAKDKILMGLIREGVVLTEEERRLVSYHEAGHAVLAATLPHADPIHKVTIIPRGRAMGVTQQLPEREKWLYSRRYLVDRLSVMMGGRAAEDLIFDTATSGAENDFKEATKLARKMVLDWGMSKSLGYVSLGGENQQVFLGEQIGQQRHYSEETAREVDEEIKSILDEAYTRAKDTLKTYREQLDELAQALLEKEELTGKEVLKLFDLDDPEKKLATAAS